MSKSRSFWSKYNIFKHWPPFVRAYRQNLSGMDLDASQRRYLKWGTIILISLFTVAWFWYSIPYFRYQSDISLFTYTGDFVRPFFDGNHAPLVSEFLWRFVSQFYLNIPLTALVVGLMVIGFCVTSRRMAGPYMPFLLPLFFLLFTSPEPRYASVAISLWLNMWALSLYFGFTRHAAHHPRSWAPLIMMHLYAMILGSVLYYATGRWALVFCSAVVLVHLFGIPMSLSDKEHGLGRIRMWNFIVSLLLNFIVSFLFWDFVDYYGYSFPWYVWAALIIYVLACLPGIVLQAYNNRKVFIYEWKKRKGLLQDGKPALAPSYHILLTLIAIGLGCVMIFVLARNPLQRTLIKTQNAVVQGDYTQSLKLCKSYFDKVPLPSGKRQMDKEYMENRNLLASYFKLSLLMKGKLDNLFLEYASLPEMAEMFPVPQPNVGVYDYSYIKIYEELGLAEPAVPQILSNMELYGLQNRFMKPLLWAQKTSGRYELMETTLYYARKTLYSRALYLEQKDDIDFLVQEYRRAEKEQRENGFYKAQAEQMENSERPMPENVPGKSGEDSLNASDTKELHASLADSSTLKNENEQKADSSRNFARAAMQSDGNRTIVLSDSSLQPGSSATGFIDYWVKYSFEQQVFGGTLLFGAKPGSIRVERFMPGDSKPYYETLRPSNCIRLPRNRALLDYYSLIVLLEKRIELMPYLMQLYHDMGIKVLPGYLQEAWCLYSGYPHSISATQLLSDKYYDFHINTETLSIIDRTYRAYEDWRNGGAKPKAAAGAEEASLTEEVRKMTGSYTYHYLFEDPR